MDAVKFIEERQRMCKHYKDGCLGCPLKGQVCGGLLNVDAKRLVAATEEWSAAHPRKTRQSMFLEQWPEAKILDDGSLSILPCALHFDEYNVDACVKAGRKCDDCRREFWMQEVE